MAATTTAFYSIIGKTRERNLVLNALCVCVCVWHTLCANFALRSLDTSGSCCTMQRHEWVYDAICHCLQVYNHSHCDNQSGRTELSVSLESWQNMQKFWIILDLCVRFKPESTTLGSTHSERMVQCFLKVSSSFEARSQLDWVISRGRGGWSCQIKPSSTIVQFDLGRKWLLCLILKLTFQQLKMSFFKNIIIPTILRLFLSTQRYPFYYYYSCSWIPGELHRCTISTALQSTYA